jgi:hypothetical protein
MTEDDRSQQLDKSPDDEPQKSTRTWFDSVDSLFLMRLILFLIVFIALISLMRRHSGQTYEGRKKGRRKGLERRENISGTTKSSRRSRGQDKSRSNNYARSSEGYPPEDEDLEEVMDALDRELKGKFVTTGVSASHEFSPKKTDRSITGEDRKNNRSTNVAHVVFKPSMGYASHCEVCMGHFKVGRQISKCICGKYYHISCADSIKICVECGNNL